MKFYLNPKRYTLNASDGFTLIEIIVSISIFTVVMLITMGALLTLNDSSRKAQALRTVIDNLNFSVEDMNRKIRTGDSYGCIVSAGGVVGFTTLTRPTPSDCLGDGGAAVLLRTQEKNENGDRIWIVYIFDKDPITTKGGIYLRSGVSKSSTEVLLTSGKLAITSPEVDIRSAKFRVIGASSANARPMIIVNIAGTVNLSKERLRTDFSLQTAISQRGI